ncbi:MAG: septum formation initiator [Bacteroidia bacterium]|nr:MAG: septum formation initiator [Bacteroidia bacterium]PIE86424.1 MAG: septum formation initiator [Bacteroidia bacterium]
MKNKIWKEIWNKIRKFAIAGGLFVIWMFFFDDNSFFNRWKFEEKLTELKEEKQYYVDKIMVDSAQLSELKTNKNKLEKFAREKYLMKKKNEDIFIIVTKESVKEAQN